MLCDKCGQHIPGDSTVCPCCDAPVIPRNADRNAALTVYSSLIMGIISVLTFGLLPGFLAIIMGYIGKRNGGKDSIADIGIVCGTAGIVLFLFFALAFRNVAPSITAP